MSPEEVVLLCGAYIFLHKSISSKKKRKRWWVRNYLLRRQDVLSDLCMFDGSFINFLRMSKSDFEYLLQNVGPFIEKQDTNLRSAVTAETRLAITLRYLATGDSYSSLSYTFRVSKQLISRIIPEVCKNIIRMLKNYIQVPSSEVHWKEKAREWNELWNCPHCVGAIDGKHVVIEAPSNSNSDYYNYKDQFSIVLLAIVDASYNVIYANCGAKGRASDSGIFQETSFYQRMVERRLNFPNQETISPDGPDLPYVILGDSAFPLSENLMRPYPGIHNRGTMNRIFNYRLCRARRVVENVFGILCVVFRVFRKAIPFKPENCELIVMACLYMHNFLRRNKQSRALYTPPMTFDFEDSDHNVIEGAWRREYTVEGTSILELERRPRNSARTATIIRDQFGEYFMSERGSLPWQNNVA